MVPLHVELQNQRGREGWVTRFRITRLPLESGGKGYIFCSVLSPASLKCIHVCWLAAVLTL